MYKFKTKPYEHQKDALKKCWNKEAFAIFAEMGTGKTKIALDNACILYNKGRIDRVLIVAPKGTYMNWVDQEIPTHVPDYVEKNVVAWKQSTSAEYKQQLKNIKDASDYRFKIMVMNVEALSTKKGVEFARIFLIGKSMMIVDESTTIKNPQAKRTKNILSLSKEAKYRRILTGSPVTQSPMDLWSQMDFLDPEILGQQSFYAFRTRYAVVITANAAGGTHKYQKIVKFKNLAQLGNLVSPHSYRILKKDCLDLPEKTFIKREVELTEEQTKAYQDMKTTAMTVLKGQSLTAVNDICRAPAEDRQRCIYDFQNKKNDCRFFIGNTQTGGYGITLTAASTVIYYSNNYDLEKRIQSEDRAHRIGQINPVLYIDMVAKKTVDEKIIKALKNKVNIAKEISGEELSEWI